MVIRAQDRVSTVIGRDESLIDVFVSLSPAFERLRKPGMRKVMSRLVTVEQAARMAGVDAEELVNRLNAHLDGAVDSNVSASVSVREGASHGPRPAALSSIPDDRVVHLDVREELRAGREPFSMIMAARRTMPPGGALTVRAIFEPVPLYAVMKRQGFEHWTERLADDDWRIWFYDAGGGAQPEPAQTTTEIRTEEDGVVVIDVRGLEPPEPMVRTLEALEQLPRGGTLVQLNVRVPQFLLPQLEQRGFTYEVREQEPGLVRVFIRHRN